MRALPAFASIGSVIASLAFCGRASADAPDTFDLTYSFDTRDEWLRAMPRLELSSPRDTPLRSIGQGELPSTGSQHFLAGTFDMGLGFRRGLLVPILGLEGGGAIGSSPRMITSLNGTTVEMHPWTSGIVSLLMPGIGYRFTERRWMFEASTRPVLSYTWMNVVVYNGATPIDWNDPPLGALALGVRAEISGCRRLDPTDRLCLFVGTRVYEYGLLNGGSIGLRWESGL